MEHTFEPPADEWVGLGWENPADQWVSDVIPADPSGLDEQILFDLLVQEYSDGPDRGTGCHGVGCHEAGCHGTGVPGAGVPGAGVSGAGDHGAGDPGWEAELPDPEAEADFAAAAISRTVALRRQMGALQARELHELAALAVWARSGRTEQYGRDKSIAHRSLVADLAAAHRVSDRTLAVRVDDAERLVNHYPASVAALAAGRVDLGHLRVIADHGLPIQDSAARAAYEQVVLEHAAEVTPGRLRRYAQLEAARVGEVSFQNRCEQAHAQRRVWVVEVGDGMSQLGVLLPTLLAEGIWDRLTQQAKAITAATRTAAHTGVKPAGVNTLDGLGASGSSASGPSAHGPGGAGSGAAGPGGSGGAGSGGAESGTFDARTFDQLRTDLVTELLLTGQPTGCEDAPHAAGVGIRAEVAVVIPMLTLLGQVQGQSQGAGDHAGARTGPGFASGTGPSTGKCNGAKTEPAAIAGKSPIDAATARRLAADAPHLVRLLTHPVTGIALTADIYIPSAKLRRFLRLRDGRCRHPGCSRAAGRCDLDHTIAWETGGTSTPENLAHLCRGHHTLKHDGGWRVKQVSPGVLEWTSPTGRVVTDRPDTWPTFTES